MTDNVIEIRDLSRTFGHTEALGGLTFEVHRGSVFGLVGENGAGKTTLIKHVLGLFKPQTGSVSVFGLDPVQDPKGVLGRIGYLSEERDMPEWMRISELMSYSQPSIRSGTQTTPCSFGRCSSWTRSNGSASFPAANGLEPVC